MQHAAEIWEARRGYYRWRCSCGAESDYFKSRREAERDHDDHVVALARGGGDAQS